MFTNFITPCVVEWLRISCLKKRDPYYDEKGYWFDKSVKVSFSRGEYQEETWCDVCPLDTCHDGLVKHYWVPSELERYKYMVDKRGKLLFPPTFSPRQ